MSRTDTFFYEFNQYMFDRYQLGPRECTLINLLSHLHRLIYSDVDSESTDDRLQQFGYGTREALALYGQALESPLDLLVLLNSAGTVGLHAAPPQSGLDPAIIRSLQHLVDDFGDFIEGVLREGEAARLDSRNDVSYLWESIQAELKTAGATSEESSAVRAELATSLVDRHPALAQSLIYYFSPGCNVASVVKRYLDTSKTILVHYIGIDVMSELSVDELARLCRSGGTRKVHQHLEQSGRQLSEQERRCLLEASCGTLKGSRKLLMLWLTELDGATVRDCIRLLEEQDNEVPLVDIIQELKAHKDVTLTSEDLVDLVMCAAKTSPANAGLLQNALGLSPEHLGDLVLASERPMTPAAAFLMLPEISRTANFVSSQLKDSPLETLLKSRYQEEFALENARGETRGERCLQAIKQIGIVSKTPGNKVMVYYGSQVLKVEVISKLEARYWQQVERLMKRTVKPKRCVASEDPQITL